MSLLFNFNNGPKPIAPEEFERKVESTITRLKENFGQNAAQVVYKHIPGQITALVELNGKKLDDVASRGFSDDFEFRQINSQTKLNSPPILSKDRTVVEDPHLQNGQIESLQIDLKLP